MLRERRGELPILGEGIEHEREARIGTAITVLAGRKLAAGDDFGIMVGEGRPCAQT